MTPSLRMRDLERDSGLPASMLRYYISEGLIPQPMRPTRNSALYGEAHLRAAVALKHLRQLDPRMSRAALQRALTLVLQGIEPEVAVSLQAAVFAQGVAQADERVGDLTFTLNELAARLDVTTDDILSLVAQDILVPLQIDGVAHFDALDERMARAVLAVREMTTDGVAVAAEVASLLRKASRLEIEFRNTLVRRGTAQESAQLSAQLQSWGNAWHGYLFARFRMREVAEMGLGVALAPTATSDGAAA